MIYLTLERANEIALGINMDITMFLRLSRVYQGHLEKNPTFTTSHHFNTIMNSRITVLM